MGDDENRESVGAENVFDDDSGISEDINNSDGEDTPTEDQNNSDESGAEDDQSGEDDGDSSEDDSDSDSDEAGDGEDDEGEKDDKTFKGTKKDPDPLSALNQELANQRRLNKDMMTIMNDPDALEEYMLNLKKERRGTKDDSSKSVGEDLDEMIEKMETVDDFRKFARVLKSKVESESQKNVDSVKKLKQDQEFIRHVEQVGNTIKSEIETARQKYPQLREKNPDGTPNPLFSKELDEKIGSLFDKLDFDPKTKLYKGGVSFLELATTIMDASSIGEKSGTKRAKTNIVDKRTGRVKSNSQKGSKPSVDESKMSPEQAIASRIQRTFQKVRSKSSKK